MDRKEEAKVRNVNYAEKQAEQEISITQILGIIKQRRVWVYVFFVLACALAVFYLKITDPSYQASATALVEPISNATSIESLLTSSTSSTKIDTEIQLITSSSNLQNALDKLDLTKYLDPDGVPYSEKELKGSKFSKVVSVSTVSSTKVVKITVEDGNPQFCADYANAILEAYTEMLTRISKNSKSAQREFLETQIPETEALLDEASEKLADFKETSGIMQMTQKNTLLTSKIAAFQLEKAPLSLQLVEVESLLASLNSDGSLMAVETIAQNDAVRVSLEEYVSNSKELMMYQNVDATASSSRVYVLESSLASNEKNVLNAVTEIVGSENTMYAKAITEYLCVKASISAIDSIIESYNEELADFPIMERQYLDLQRDVEIYEQLLLSLRQLLEETKMVEAAVVGNVNVIDEAVVPIRPVSPKKLMVMAIAVVGGVVLGVLFGLFLEFIDDSIRSEDSIKQILGSEIPSLGWTPYVKNVEKIQEEIPALYVFNDPDAAVSERFKSIANNIVYSFPKKIQVLSINSTEMGEGKTTAICNVATAYALSDKKVLLIDGDFRKPAIEAFFCLKRSKLGFVDAIVDDVPLEKCIVRPLAQVPNLHLMPPGKGTRNPNALYNSPKADAVLAKLKAVYDYIIIDCPPISYGSEFTHLARYLDGFVINVRAGVSSKRALSSFMSELDFINAPLLGYIYYGVIARNQSSYSNYGYGSYYGNKKYGYGYGYGYGNKKSMYEEGKGNYKIIYKKEIQHRSEFRHGNHEPVLAFAGGAENAFTGSQSAKAGNVSQVLKPEAKPAQKSSAKPSGTKMSAAEKKTSDMLADIEKIYRK